jgi:putative phosphoserine phosphatase/1-acylglycerol-3-phosphate O-acyltransferase
MTFIDRADNAKAREALEPVVEAIRGGKSLMISPEGTRTPTPRLGPFKKGPFHIAMQAQVPVVAIVLKGIHTVQSRGGQIIRPGSVEVVVLPPFLTDDWQPQSVGAHADEVRSAMLDVLRDWPNGETS